MFSYKELARLRKVRRALNMYARGNGAASARWQLDEWIAEEKEMQDHLKEHPLPALPPRSGLQKMEKGIIP